jgi:hypothetical protein
MGPSNQLLLWGWYDAVVMCYGNVKEQILRKIGTGFSKICEAGPDPTHIEYSYADLTLPLGML